MSIQEKRFWQLIKNHLPGDVSRIENIADDGTPDVTGAYYQDYWIELKVCQNKRMIRDVKLLLRDSQYVWHLRRAKYKSLIFVAVYYPEMKQIYLYKYRDNYYKEICIISTGKYWEHFERIIQEHIARW